MLIRLRHIRFLGARLRAVAAVLFLLLAASQPGLNVQANAGGMHEMGAMAAMSDQSAGVDCSHHHRSGNGQDKDLTTGQVAGDAHDCGSGGPAAPADTSCQVHCAPAAALLFDFPQLPVLPVAQHPAQKLAALSDGIAVEFIKPPRT